MVNGLWGSDIQQLSVVIGKDGGAPNDRLKRCELRTQVFDDGNVLKVAVVVKVEFDVRVWESWVMASARSWLVDRLEPWETEGLE